MAHHYRRPLIAFYLDTPPPRGDRGADFRRLSAPPSAENEAIVDTLVRNIQSRQNMVRSLLEEEEEAVPCRFVGILTKRKGVSSTEAAGEFASSAWTRPNEPSVLRTTQPPRRVHCCYAREPRPRGCSLYSRET